MALNIRKVDPLPHHEQKETCNVRAAYRQGRKDTAVKVYTINLESTYLLIMGVPTVGANQELEVKCRGFGDLLHFVALDEYPAEEFTEVYLVRFEKLQSARVAKRKLDCSSFFGGVLHVCFAPEFESVDDTREKLISRQKFVSIATKSGFTGPWDTRRGSGGARHVNEKPDPMTLPPTDNVGPQDFEPTTYIWAGKTYTMPNPNSLPPTEQAGPSNQSYEPQVKPKIAMFVPRQALNPAKKRPTDETSSSAVAASEAIRNKLQTLSTPNVAVMFKKRKM